MNTTYEPQVTVLSDETLGCVQREYREVERQARVGERIKTLRDCCSFYHEGDVATVTETYEDDADSVRADFSGNEYVNGKGVWYVGNDIGYVVLEPTDVVVLDGQRYRMVERKADVGDRVIVVNATCTFGDYDNGDVFTVKYLYHNDGLVPNEVDDKNFGYIAHDEYRVLERLDVPKAPVEQTAEDALAALERRVTDLEREVSSLKRQDVKDAAPVVTQSPTLTRDEIVALTRDQVVEMAKKDVQTLIGLAGCDMFAAPTTARHGHMTVKFEINRVKRTVVALLYWMHCNVNTVQERGKAHCAPDDCFNVHIGRAIALRRALGLDVPSEYLKASQPTEARVGDVVRGIHTPSKNYYSTDKTFTLTKDNGSSFKYAEHSGDWIYKRDIGRIIDDSREADDSRDQGVRTADVVREPKIGDKVRVIDETKTNIGIHNVHDGEVGKITRIRNHASDNAYIYWIEPLDRPWGVWSSRECFELIEE